MTRPRWTVTDDGMVPHPGGCRIEVDGINVAPVAVSYRIDHDYTGRATLTLTVQPIEITAIGDTEPRWAGLDHLPASALRQALEVAEEREANDA